MRIHLIVPTVAAAAALAAPAALAGGTTTLQLHFPTPAKAHTNVKLKATGHAARKSELDVFYNTPRANKCENDVDSELVFDAVLISKNVKGDFAAKANINTGGPQKGWLCGYLGHNTKGGNFVIDKKVTKKVTIEK